MSARCMRNGRAVGLSLTCIRIMSPYGSCGRVIRSVTFSRVSWADHVHFSDSAPNRYCEVEADAIAIRTDERAGGTVKDKSTPLFKSTAVKSPPPRACKRTIQKSDNMERPPVLSGVHHIKLPVSSIDKTKLFYTDVVGLKQIPEFDHMNEQGDSFAVILEANHRGIPMLRNSGEIASKQRSSSIRTQSHGQSRNGTISRVGGSGSKSGM